MKAINLCGSGIDSERAYFYRVDYIKGIIIIVEKTKLVTL